MALVDQAHGGRQGQANYFLYGLAKTADSSYPTMCNGSNASSTPASSCVFNDVTLGNNVVPGESGNSYQAGSGYDQTTGLGSVNVENLVDGWDTVNFNPTTTALTITVPNTITHGAPVPFEISVIPNTGTGIPTGAVALLAYNTGIGGVSTGQGAWTLSSGLVSGSISSLPGGSYNLAAQYGGDANYAPSTSPQDQAVFIYPEGSTTNLSVLTANQNGQTSPFTGGPFGSFVYLRADVAGLSGQGIPTGIVTFVDAFGPIPGFPYPLPLNSEGNTATTNGVFTFDAGTHTISATYGGDGSFNASATTQSQTFVITPGFFCDGSFNAIRCRSHIAGWKRSKLGLHVQFFRVLRRDQACLLWAATGSNLHNFPVVDFGERNGEHDYSDYHNNDDRRDSGTANAPLLLAGVLDDEPGTFPFHVPDRQQAPRQSPAADRPHADAGHRYSRMWRWRKWKRPQDSAARSGHACGDFECIGNGNERFGGQHDGIHARGAVASNVEFGPRQWCTIYSHTMSMKLSAIAEALHVRLENGNPEAEISGLTELSKPGREI